MEPLITSAESCVQATGLGQRVDSRIQVSYVEGRHGRAIPIRSLVTVDGGVARLNATVAEKDYRTAFGFQDFSPFFRIELRPLAGEPLLAEGTISQTPGPKRP